MQGEEQGRKNTEEKKNPNEQFVKIKTKRTEFGISLNMLFGSTHLSTKAKQKKPEIIIIFNHMTNRQQCISFSSIGSVRFTSSGYFVQGLCEWSKKRKIQIF